MRRRAVMEAASERDMGGGVRRSDQLRTLTSLVLVLPGCWVTQEELEASWDTGPTGLGEAVVAAECDAGADGAASFDGTLAVELTWDTTDTNLDLHVLFGDFDDGPATLEENLFLAPLDCTWCNANPDWGIADEEVDDPSFACDDRDGYGPEVVSVGTAAEGVYAIAVHYLDDLGGGASVASARVYVSGVLKSEHSRALESGDVWHVVTVVLPSEVVMEIDADPYESTQSRCR